jgi:hypothetical protein
MVLGYVLEVITVILALSGLLFQPKRDPTASPSWANLSSAGRLIFTLIVLGFLVKIGKVNHDSRSQARQSTQQQSVIDQQNRQLQTLNTQMEQLLTGNDILQKRLQPFEQLALHQYPQLATEMALAKLAEDLKRQGEQIETVRDYTEIAKYNFVGTSGTAVPPLYEHTAISRMLEGAFTITDNRCRYLCDHTSMKKFEAVITQYPRFPFAYWFGVQFHWTPHEV